jgi:hypothetical protein
VPNIFDWRPRTKPAQGLDPLRNLAIGCTQFQERPGVTRARLHHSQAARAKLREVQLLRPRRCWPAKSREAFPGNSPHGSLSCWHVRRNSYLRPNRAGRPPSRRAAFAASSPHFSQRGSFPVGFGVGGPFIVGFGAWMKKGPLSRTVFGAGERFFWFLCSPRARLGGGCSEPEPGTGYAGAGSGGGSCQRRRLSKTWAKSV